MSSTNNIASDGGIMDDNDMVDLRAIELALQNPKPGTPAARTLEQLAARARELDAQMFPTSSHPTSGLLCFCRAHCAGTHCHCWCHAGESL
jgi:hypothetical protein